MGAIDELNAEHQAIEQMLRVLRVLGHRLRLGAAVPPAHVDSMMEFLDVFVDRCHHAKEEEHLFPALAAVGVRDRGGPLEALRNEHQRGRELVGQLRAGLAKRATDPLGGGLAFAAAAEEYQGLMLLHMDKETGMLFAAAALVSFGISAASAAQPQVVAAVAAGAPERLVVDKGPVTQAQTPLELLLFVHRADLPLRPLPSKQKDHS